MGKKIYGLLIIFLCIIMTNVIAIPNTSEDKGDNSIAQEAEANKEITSETYIVSKEKLIISRILPNTTIKEFKSKFNVNNNTVHVYDETGKEEKESGYIGTGMQIKFTESETTYIASVIGDINGNGKIEQIEVSKAIKHVIGLAKHQITGIYAVAMDMSGDGRIDQKDVSILIKYVVTDRLEIGDPLRPAEPIIEVKNGTEGKNDWYTSNVTVEIKKPEESVIEFTNMIVEVTGSINNEPTQIPEGTTINIEEEGIYEIKSYTISASGVKSIEAKKTIKIDKTTPTSAELIAKYKDENGENYDFTTTSYQNIYLETTTGEDEVSKIEEVTIQATGANVIPAGTKAPVILENDGETEVTITTINKAGLSTTKTYTISIDKVVKNPGSVTTKINNAEGEEYEKDTWTNQDVYVEVKAGGEGITTSYQVEGANIVEKTHEPTVLTEEGISTIIVFNEDTYGNVSKSNITVKIDKTEPNKPEYTIEGTKIIEDSQWYTQDPSVTLTAENGEHGAEIDYIEYELKETISNVIQKGNVNNGGGVNILKEGIFELTATSVDVAGNKSESVLINIKIDKTDPTVGTMQLKKNNEEGEVYTNDTWINQDIYVELENGSDDLSGHYSTVYQITGPVNTEKITEPQIVTQEGTYNITVTTTDISGRSSERTYTIKIDKQNPEKPTYEIVSGTKQSEENEWYNSNVAIKVLQGDTDLGGSGISHTTYTVSGKVEIEETQIENEGIINLEEEGIYNITLYNYDVAGNKSEATTFTIKMDKTDPVAGTLNLYKNNQEGATYTNDTWTNQDIYIELENGSDALSGHYATVYKIEGTVNKEASTEPVKITQEGTYTITVTTTDIAGRTSERIYTIKIDKQKPEVPTYEIAEGEKSEAINEWYNNDVTIKVLQGTVDLGGSGISHTTYKVSGRMEREEITIENEGTITLQEEGIYDITLYNYDVAGNKSEENTFTIKLDKTAPQNIEINETEVTGTKISTTISVDEEVSGVAIYQIYVDGQWYTDIETSEKEVNCDITNQTSGMHEVLVKVKDVAGNENEASKEINMGRLVASDIDCIEFMIKDFTKTKEGENVASGTEYIVSDTSISEVAKYIQISTQDNQVTGEITGSIRVIRKDGSVVEAFEYYPEELVIAIAQYSDGSGSTWAHEASVNMANTTLTNSEVEEGISKDGSISIKEKQNSDNTFKVKDKKTSGTRTYTRLIIKEITSNGQKVPFKITSSVI